MRAARALAAPAASLLAALAALGCGRDSEAAPEARWSPSTTQSVVRTTTLEAGPKRADPMATNPYAEDSRALAEGRLLYGSFNCAGCHGGNGGGAIGPPFADADWIYGSEPENIFQSVAQGRPNGMPTFGGKIPPETLWKIVAYVRSLDPTLPKAGQRKTGPSEGVTLTASQGGGGGGGPVR